jgi:putative transposase
MGLARSTYYDGPASQPIEEARLVERIKEICAEWPAYGYRRVTAQLHAEGMIVNHKKLMRLMREHDLTVRPRRRFMATTDSDHDGPIFPNLAKDMVPTGPNQLWVADITCIAIAVGFVYLAAILDAWSGRVVGYAINRRVDARLALCGTQSGDRRPSAAARLSTIPIAARNMLPRTTAPSSRRTVSTAPWAGVATPTTMPRPRAS